MVSQSTDWSIDPVDIATDAVPRTGDDACSHTNAEPWVRIPFVAVGNE